MLERFLADEAATMRLGEDLAMALRPGDVLALHGDLGAGKSTLARALSERLIAAGLTARTTREPGGSPKAEAIREMILAGQARDYGPFAEALMFSAARIDHIDSLIRPALERGEWVICDRFIDSTRVYQGLLGGVPRDLIGAIESHSVAPTVPDLTFVMDLPAEVGLKRAEARGALSRFDAQSTDYHRRLREGFREIARAEPARCLLIDADRDPDTIAGEIWRTVAERFLVKAP